VADPQNVHRQVERAQPVDPAADRADRVRRSRPVNRQVQGPPGDEIRTGRQLGRHPADLGLAQAVAVQVGAQLEDHPDPCLQEPTGRIEMRDSSQHPWFRRGDRGLPTGRAVPWGQHEHLPGVLGQNRGQLPLRADRHRAHLQPGSFRREPADTQAIAVALAYRHQPPPIGGDHAFEVCTPAGGVHVQQQTRGAGAFRIRLRARVHRARVHGVRVHGA
jgi:hypothetical protein